MTRTLAFLPRKRVVGKLILFGWAKSIGKLRSFWLGLWYGLAWKINRPCNFAGPIRRRAYGGDAYIGARCDLGHGLVIDVASGGILIVGSNVSINGGTYISVLGRVEIGNDCRIGEYCSIRDNDHIFSDPDLAIRDQGMRQAAVVLGRGVWLGRGVVVQPGVTIGDGAVIGANSFVNCDVPPFAIAVGTPARVLRLRK